MPLGSGSITFSQIVSEWGLTGLKGPATYSESSPMSMRQYLRGASIYFPDMFETDYTGYVPNNYGSTGGVPSSGNLNMSSLKNTTAEWDGQACLNEFYNYRGFYSRNWSSTGYAGDNFVSNNHYNRYNSSWTWYTPFGNDSPGGNTGYSKWQTQVTAVLGAQSHITGYSTGNSGTAQNTPESLVWYSEYGEMPVGLVQVRTMARSIGSGSITYSRLGNNSGSWPHQWHLPGKWTVYDHRLNPVTNTGASATPATNGYNVVVPAGCAYLMTTYYFSGDVNLTGGQTVTASNGDVVQQTSSWWYNGSASVFYVNKNATSVTLNYPNGLVATYDKSNNFAGNSAGFWFGTNYHQELFLSRTY